MRAGRRIQRKRLLGYSVAVLSVAVAFGLTLLLAPWLYPTVTPLFFVAVMISAWLGGWEAGLLATVLSTLVISYFWIEPRHSLQIFDVRTIVQLGLFAIAAGFISWLSQSRHRALADARANYQTLWETRKREAVAQTRSNQTEEALRQSEARLRVVAANLPQGAVFVVDRDLRYLLAEGQAIELAGMTSEDLVSKTIWEALEPDLANRYAPYFRQALNGESFSYEHDSHDRHYVSHGTPLVNDQGEIYAVLAMSYDITDRKRVEDERAHVEAALRQSESRFRLMVESAKEYAIFTLDLNGIVTGWNFGAERLLGYSETEIVGRAGRIIFTPEDDAQGKPDREMQLALSQGQAENERWHIRKDGSRFWGSGLVMPLQDEAGTTQGLIKILQDKTTERQNAAEREQLLQREQAAREEAENANRIKDEFLAVLSHELRSPLNPILGWAKLLKTGNLNAAKTTQAITTIERNAKLQSDLIEDLLDVSRILQGKLSLNATSVDLAATIRGAIETVRLAAEAKSINLQCTILDLGLKTRDNPKSKTQNPKFRVAGDATRLQQIVWNLLSNAVKFTPTGGRVEVRLEQVDRQAQITVSDNGKGIPGNFLPYVFDYFRQEDGATTRKFGGLGLGLAIVRHLVELHGGTVSVASEGEGLGATFTVRLPLMPRQQPIDSDPASPSGSFDLTGIQVLVVDDEADSQNFTAFVVEQAGASVTTAASAAEAIALLTHSQFDLLLSDIGMPEMDGYTLLQQVRRLPPEQNGQVKAIALTAYAGDFNQQQALHVGYQQHVSKPVEPEALVKAIRALVIESV